ncbi:MAG: aminomethyl-transferring glycine dehydrogenase subunit GcvPB [Sphaerochaetaceae bacterium]|nr:aminomethyl-transferring glycine dehydrogenase subunit GcvPB [Sphaerochaetaceae bacterium]MDD3941611.1 aminomethyl-transferring glycine dehydrogenase subunit GcvPB [Sphaerochaetaceae bacterium]
MSEPSVFELSKPGRRGYAYPVSDVPVGQDLPAHLRRKDPPKLPELSELATVRHFSRLARMSFGVDYGLYPLGSCTMKYNPKMHNEVAALEGFARLHPLQDDDTVQGALMVMERLTASLGAITGMAGGTVQPSAGAHGEYTGLKIIRAYHLAREDHARTKMIVPVSAHGTNPASAALTGFSIVEVPTDDRGLVDTKVLETLLDETVAGIMLTNPNTLGLFERDIMKIASMVHSCGALLYYDGANMNAIMGMVRPADMGFDVVHLNLHKTFSTPHGGGGPGAGPILVTKRLLPFLPRPGIKNIGNVLCMDWEERSSIGKVSGFWGNFLVLLRAYAYVLTMGCEGLREASRHAVLNANYLRARMNGMFLRPYEGLCMHEFVVSAQRFKEQYGVGALDFSKALLDRGIHPPTMYFPLIVHEALMIEPTETESLEDLDAFVTIMAELVGLASTDPDHLLRSPLHTEVRRLDEVRAAKNPSLRHCIDGMCTT